MNCDLNSIDKSTHNNPRESMLQVSTSQENTLSYSIKPLSHHPILLYVSHVLVC